MRFLLVIAALIAVAATSVACGSSVVEQPASRRLAVGGEDGVPAAVGALRLESVVALSGGRVGGLSGLRVAPGRDRFLAVSDEGDLVSGRLIHDSAGRLRDIADVRRSPLPGTGGGKKDDDAEELAVLPDGDVLVSFERHHRILRFPPDFAADVSPRRLPSPPGLNDAPANGGVEALAAFADGALLALEEGADDGRAERRGWFAAAVPQVSADWRPLTYRAAPGYRPTGAAALPDGDALVLERRVSWSGGWSARVTLLRRDDMIGGGAVVGRELAQWGPPLPSDNFEAVAATAARPDVIDVYLLSDDNFSPLQTTLFVHLTLSRAVLGDR